jgi:hypothetical protein
VKAKRVTPIPNVSNIVESLEWFEKLGWSKGWELGRSADVRRRVVRRIQDLPVRNGQGGPGNSDVKMTSGPEGDESADKVPGCRFG